MKRIKINKPVSSIFSRKSLLTGMLLLLVNICCLQLFAQNRTITGVVVDEMGDPVTGANVSVAGSTVGAMTDIDGKFSLNAPASGTLVISYIGYKKLEVALGQATYNITLLEDVEALEEVVVIGYGVQRKEAVTGSVASMKGDKMRDIASTNISQALQGRVAGVEMMQTSSKPGAEMQIRIRGTRSLNASNDPLIVLDGIPFAGTMSDINPNEIKSVDILKDASATAIYGSRGANGVLLVSTNRGENGKKATVTYNGYYGVRNLYSKFDMMDGPTFSKMRKYANVPAYVNNAADEFDNMNTDWQDLYFKTGSVNSHDVGITGGTSTGAYSFGLGYYKDDGVVPMENYSRFTLRGSLDQEIGKLFRFGITTNNTYNVTERANSGGIYQILQMTPLIDPYNADGTWKRTVRMPSDEPWTYTRDIVEANKEMMLNQTKGFGSYNTIYGEVKIPGVEGLKYRVNVGLNLRMQTGGAYTGEGINNTSPTAPSSASINNSLRTNWAIENMITYDRIFAEKHSVNAVLLYSAEETMFNRSAVNARDIPAHFQWFNLGQTSEPITVDPSRDAQQYQKSGLMSYMGRVIYSYDSRYMLSVALRSDASSRLAKGHQWHTYPAVSAGWNMKREKFMDNVDWLNYLKIRAGYGVTSNQAVDPYRTLGLLATRPYNFGDEYFDTGYYVSELPNDNLGWEYSTTWNYGIDFTILKNRISGTFEYYITNTKDLLLSVNLPATSGVGSYMANVGETQNKGFEFSLNANILDNYNGWTWDVGFNLYSNKNKIVALASGATEDKGNAWFVGKPINAIYSAKKIGLWQEGDPYMDVLEPGGNVGMIKIEYLGDYDASGKPVRAMDGGGEDRQVIEVDPDFQGGFNTMVGYKGFDLNIIGSFISGGILPSSLYSANGYLNMLTGRRGQVNVDYWTPENTGAKYPKPGGIISGDSPKYANTLGYFDATYVKLRAITLGYNFKQKAIRNLGIQNFRVYATIQNPLVLYSPYTKETGLDPETNSYGNENMASSSGFVSRRILTQGTNSPATRSFLFGLNLTF